MRKILCLIYACIGIIGIAHADTMNVNWYVNDSVYDTTTCTIGGDINLPATPTKRGHTFRGWAIYTPIEYIESTGAQWIDTGIYLTGNSKVEITVNIPSANGNYALFGASNGNSATTGEFSLFWYNGTYQAVCPTGPNSSAVSRQNGQYTLVTNIKQTLAWSKQGFYVDDVLRENPAFYTGYVGTRSLTLFAVHRNAVGYAAAFKLYSARIWDYDVLVRDMIPVLDDNGVACMYDKVSHTFFYNSGPGIFMAGPVITE